MRSFLRREVETVAASIPQQAASPPVQLIIQSPGAVTQSWCIFWCIFWFLSLWCLWCHCSGATVIDVFQEAALLNSLFLHAQSGNTSPLASRSSLWGSYHDLPSSLYVLRNSSSVSATQPEREPLPPQKMPEHLWQLSRCSAQ